MENCWGIWHDTIDSMSYIEKWRMEELSLVLNRMALILQAGGQSEWAGVFHHYQDEAETLARIPPIEIEKAERLACNLRACLRDGGSLRQPQLSHEDQSIGSGLLREYLKLRMRLLQILDDLEERLTLMVH